LRISTFWNRMWCGPPNPLEERRIITTAFEGLFTPSKTRSLNVRYCGTYAEQWPR
jgi:hypothetical protein